MVAMGGQGIWGRKKTNVFKSIQSGFSKIEDLIVLKAIRKGLTLTIPILLIGSFCLVLLNLPLPAYQDLLTQFPLIREFPLAVHSVTLGAFSLYAAFSISLGYAQAYAERKGNFFVLGAPFAGIGAYLMLIGMGSPDFSITVLSTRSLFIALLAGLIGSAIYCALSQNLSPEKKMYGSGSTTDGSFNRALSALKPVTVIILGAAVINVTVSTAFGVQSLEELVFHGISEWFPSDASSLESGLLYLLLNNSMWFFGLHGGNMLSGVADTVFVPGTEINAGLIASGLQPTEIITKTSLDVFASMGGAGALFSLLLAVLFFGRNRSIKKLSRMAAVPMVFNINEIALFGLPVILNPALLIPFILVPLVNLLIFYVATALGLVPYVSVDVSWVTPPLIGGYLATGSYAGAILQAVNLVVGMIIYLPFLRIYENALEQSELDDYEGLLAKFRDSELGRGNLMLTALPGTHGLLARALSEDLRRSIAEGSLDLYYQPQFDVHDKGIGAEALLRWNHPVHGLMYPPLVVKLAEEIDILKDLENAVLEGALDDAQRIQVLAKHGMIRSDFTISVNATAGSLQEGDFVERAIAGVQERALDPGRLIIEATEHDALGLNDETTTLLSRLIEAGIPLAIDDFSMGHTSFKYLETSAFTVVKLDGAIARGVMRNTRYADIVSSITRLSEQLGFRVLAEYVETREQRDQLERLGCTIFQGYLYSPAIPFEDMLELVEKGSAQKQRTEGSLPASIEHNM